LVTCELMVAGPMSTTNRKLVATNSHLAAILASSLVTSKALTTSSTSTCRRVVRLFVRVMSTLTSHVLTPLSTMKLTTKRTTSSQSKSRSTTLSLQGVSTSISMLKSHRYRHLRHLCHIFRVSISSIMVYRSSAIVIPNLQILALLLLRNQYRQLSRNLNQNQRLAVVAETGIYLKRLRTTWTKER
jgi:hypothetical protein